MEEFEEYYDAVSMYFESDKEFEIFVTSVWSIDKLAYEKQKQAALKKKRAD